MHERLRDQLKSQFGRVPDIAELPQEWGELLANISQTYEEVDTSDPNINHKAEGPGDYPKPKDADLLGEHHIISTVLDHTSALVLLVDLDGRIIWFNPSFHELTGHALPDACNKYFWEIVVSEQQQAAIKNIFTSLMETHKPIKFRTFSRTKQSGTRLIEWSYSLVEDDYGTVKSVVCTGIDNTQQRRAEADREVLLVDLRHRTNQLQTAAAVSKSVVAILNPDELIPHTVNLIKEAFSFYYVGLFLVDDNQEYAVLRAGTGEAGRLMLDAQHRHKIGDDSMVGKCVAASEACITLDASLAPHRFEEPLLPHTQSELALPLVSRGECLGALTVHSTQSAAFTEEDIAVLQTMADQIAGAIENARLYSAARHEIEERKQAQQKLEENRNLLKIIIDTLPTYFHVKDLDGRFIQINRWSKRLYEPMKIDSVLGKTDFDFYQPDIAQQFRSDELEVIGTGKPIINKEELNIDAKGRKRWFLTTKAPLHDANGKIIGTVGASQDITAQKEAEFALRLAHQNLEQRVKERTIQLEAANEELESFAYSVSHDLRSPLRAIDGFSQALLEDHSDSLDQEGRDYLGRVRKASQRMGQLIDDLLMLSRVTRSDLKHEDVNLSALAAEIAGEIKQRDPDRNGTFEIEADLIVKGDARLLIIVLENLLNNAWKFTSRRDEAHISFGRNAQSGEYFVRDNGVGFDMAFADKLFGAFQRLHTVEEFDGTGVGLATVRRIIHRHGGRIWAEGSIEKGATFYFSL